jgi:type I restriction-modification system DNA methylase subunit
MAVPKPVLNLVETFDRNIEAYKANQLYNETQLRREFIDPFFEALGWDVTNKQGYAPAYRDVIHEDAIKIGSATKAPDYSFRIGGARKFFLEAKKPSVDVKGDPHPAYQLRRYAWSAKLPLSILTDFEEFAVYDCRSKPLESDSSSTARIILLNYKDYADNWDKIAEIFSKDAVLKGSFDKFITSTKTKRGTTTVDIEFLAEIEGWRQTFAKTIAHRNRELTIEQINFAVQKIVDRILFLRMCEDRGIESYGQLLSLINGDDVYPRLCTLFEKADAKYNSGIFHFHKEPDRAEPPDELTLNLSIDDRDLKYIINSIYYPKSPYEFSVLPPEILGNVYEQFLGKVISVSPARHIKIEEKPEVKKAGGVYYTPAYIVDYIVKNTVGRLLNDPDVITTGADQPFSSRRHGDSSCHSREIYPLGSGNPPQSTAVRHCEEAERSRSRRSNLKPLTPKEIENLKILDPACGSGSFLLGAYTYLLNYVRDWYVQNNPEKFQKQIYQLRAGQWFLTIAEKKKILLNNIFGVDIDQQAVEVTKLSLLLKTLEGETSETIGQTYKMFHERALPDLGNNIKCGNSLIGPDFFENKDPASIGPDEYKRINPFDWQKEFPQIFSRKNPGFDAVIGNPPYVRVRQIKNDNPLVADYFEEKYKCAVHVWDIYLLFFEKAVSLIGKGGFVSFIIPVQTLHQPNCESIRKLFVEETNIKQITNLSQIKVFQSAIVKNCIIVVEKPKRQQSQIAISEPKSYRDLTEVPFDRHWPQDSVTKETNYSLKTDLLSVKRLICDKMDRTSIPLGDLYYVTFGLRSCAKGKGQGGKDRLITANGNLPNTKPYLEGREIKKYSIFPSGRFIRYIPEKMYSPRDPKLFETKKIISQTMLSKMKLIATLDTEHFYVEQSLLCIIPHGILTPSQNVSVPKLEFILGILNSRSATFYYATKVIDYSLGGGLIHATPGSQGKIPIPKIDKGNRSDKAKHNKMVSLVEQMLDLHKKLSDAKIPDEKTRLQRQIDSTDRQIDNLVYELYNLTKEEISIVEGKK